MKIVIAGTSGKGTIYGTMLKKAGHDVSFVDLWQSNIDKINRRGLFVNNLGNEEKTFIKAFLPIHYKEPAELYILFTDGEQLDNMLKFSNYAIGEETKVLCFVEGNDNLEVIKKYVPEGNVVLGKSTMTAELLEAGKAAVTNYGETEIQNEEIKKLFAEAGLN